MTGSNLKSEYYLPLEKHTPNPSQEGNNSE
jgi:hypothetical protein